MNRNKILLGFTVSNLQLLILLKAKTFLSFQSKQDLAHNY